MDFIANLLNNMPLWAYLVTMVIGAIVAGYLGEFSPKMPPLGSTYNHVQGWHNTWQKL